MLTPRKQANGYTISQYKRKGVVETSLPANYCPNGHRSNEVKRIMEEKRVSAQRTLRLGELVVRFQPFRIQINPGPENAVEDRNYGAEVQITKRLAKWEIVYVWSEKKTSISLAPLQIYLKDHNESNRYQNRDEEGRWA